MSRPHHSRTPPRNRLAKVLPERFRQQLLDAGVPKRKYTAVCKCTLFDGRVIDELIIEEGWVIALTRDGLGGVFEQRIDFDVERIERLDVLQVV